MCVWESLERTVKTAKDRQEQERCGGEGIKEGFKGY